MHYTIDRIEENMVVCEAPDQSLIRLPLSKLPSGLKEGDVLKKNGETFLLDIQATEERKKLMRKKLMELYE